MAKYARKNILKKRKENRILLKKFFFKLFEYTMYILKNTKYNSNY